MMRRYVPQSQDSCLVLIVLEESLLMGVQIGGGHSVAPRLQAGAG